MNKGFIEGVQGGLIDLDIGLAKGEIHTGSLNEASIRAIRHKLLDAIRALETLADAAQEVPQGQGS